MYFVLFLVNVLYLLRLFLPFVMVGRGGGIAFFIFLRKKKVLLSKNLSKIILFNFPILYFLFICCLFYCKLGQNIIYNHHLNICFLPFFKKLQVTT